MFYMKIRSREATVMPRRRGVAASCILNMKTVTQEHEILVILVLLIEL